MDHDTELLLISEDEFNLLKNEDETTEEYEQLKVYVKSWIKDNKMDLPDSEIKNNINKLFC